MNTRLTASLAIAGGVLVVGGIGAGIGFGIYTEVTAPTHGRILNKDYEPAYFYYSPGYTSCSGSGSYRSCMTMPGHMVYVPASWSFDLRDCTKQNDPASCNVGWRDVDEGTYDSYTIGEYFPG